MGTERNSSAAHTYRASGRKHPTFADIEVRRVLAGDRLMPSLPILDRKPAAGTSGDGLDFVLLMATPPQEKGKVDVYIFKNRA